MGVLIVAQNLLFEFSCPDGFALHLGTVRHHLVIGLSGGVYNLDRRHPVQTDARYKGPK